jgi:hypothetical protein
MLSGGIRVAVVACAIVGALVFGQTAAAEHRNVPRSGVSLTYKILITTTLKTATVHQDESTGWNYTYWVRSSDDVTAEGTIELTTLYSAPNCLPGACDAVRRAMEQLKARKEGDLYAVDIPPDVTRALTKLSAFRWRYFIPELVRVAFPTIRTGPGKEGFDPAAAAVQSTRIDCDRAALESFFPLGKSPRASVACTQSLETSRTQPPTTETRSPQKMIFELSYEGPGQVTTPAGDWPVQKIRMTASWPTSPANWESEILFSDKLGAIVKEHSVTKMGNSGVTVQNDRELIAVSQ